MNYKLFLKHSLYIFFILFLFSCEGKNEIIKISLTREWWQYSKMGQNEWKRTPLPTNIHSALSKDTVISGIYKDTNIVSNKWIENENWEFRRDIEINKKILLKDKIELVFEGIDTYSEIYLNDSLILETNNMFRTWEIDCKSKFKYGKNELLVKLFSPITKENDLLKNTPYNLFAGKQTITRKAAFHYGTNIGFRKVSVGIYKPVYIRAWDNAIIKNVQIYTQKIEDNTAFLKADFEINSVSEKTALIRINNEEIFTSDRLD